MGDRPKTRRGQSTREDLKAVVDEALAPIKEEIAKLPQIDAINLLLNKLGTSIKSEFEEQLKSRDDRIIALENTIEMLEGKLCVVDRLDKRIDDGEQYSRRVCLRIDNIPLPDGGQKENCIEKVAEIMEGMDCGLEPSDIDRAHRIGKKKTDKHEITRQQMIVKFKSFGQRTRMYQNRKNAKNGMKVKVDLTRRRLGILAQANEYGEMHDQIDFVFADVNCNLALRLKDGGFVYFDSLDVLKLRINGP